MTQGHQTQLWFSCWRRPCCAQDIRDDSVYEAGVSQIPGDIRFEPIDGPSLIKEPAADTASEKERTEEFALATVGAHVEVLPVVPPNEAKVATDATRSRSKDREAREFERVEREAKLQAERFAREKEEEARRAEARWAEAKKAEAKKEEARKQLEEEQAKEQALHDERLGPLAKQGAFVEVLLDSGWVDCGEDQFKQICDHIGGGESRFTLHARGSIYVVDWTDPQAPKQINPSTRKERLMRVSFR